MKDQNIELPPLPYPYDTPAYRTVGAVIQDYARAAIGPYAQRIAAIEADRKRQYLPVYLDGWEDALEWAERSRKRRGEPGVTTTQVLITLGKVIAGYRPGEEGWSEYDQQAYDIAMSIPQPLSESDMFVELVGGLSAEQLAEILVAYIKPEIIGEALEKLENAPWELSEPVAADFLAKGKLHGPLGWIANNTNPEPVNSDRQMLLKLMEAFDIETWQCPSCGHTEDTATMDSAYMLRDYLKDATVAEPVKVDTEVSVQSDDDVFSRLYEIANRDTAVSVTVRADDLRDLLARYGNTQQEK